MYDVIDHDKLLEKLDHYGIRGTIEVCLKFYFILQTHFVEIISICNKYSMNSYRFTPGNIKYGIPQGCTLGTFAFIINK
jgi:hypothetical protein